MLNKRNIILRTVLVLLLCMNTYAFYRVDDKPTADYEPRGLIVKFTSDRAPRITADKSGALSTGIRKVDDLNAKYNVKRLSPLLPAPSKFPSVENSGSIFLFEVDESTDIQILESEYEKLPGVIYAEPDYTVEFYEVPDDPLFQYQWNLNNTGQQHHHVLRNWGSYNDALVMVEGTADADIDATEVYQNPPQDATTVVVAIIDSGVDLDHPDLIDNIWTNPREVPDNGIDDDNNGYIDDMHGWDFGSSLDLLNIGDNDPTDEMGHGTHCAGIVAAVADNSAGIAGIIQDCKIMALKFEPLPLVSRIAKSIIYAADNGADVINMSFGLPFRSDLIEEAARYATRKGVILCAASGNDGTYTINFPAGYESTIAIGASNDSDHVTTFSTYGDHLSVCAPGLSILSLRADNTDMYASEYPREPGVHIVDDTYYLASGTSMASPHVVGVAAWLRSASPGLTPEKVKEIIEQSADDIIDPYGVGWNLPGRDQHSGYGRVNLDGALQLAPGVRAGIESPLPNEIISDTTHITGIADGSEPVSYVIELGEGDNPLSWTQLFYSQIPSMTDTLFTWNTDTIPAGRYTLRLSVGEDNKSYVSVFVVNETAAEITSPASGENTANFVSFIGNAYSPEFSYLLMEYKPVSSPDGWQTISDASIPVFDGVLAGWYLEDVTAGSYDIRLTVVSSDSTSVSDTITIDVQSIFSTEDAWKADLDGYPTVIPNYGDFDADGENEIIVGTSSGVTAFNLDGTPKTTGMPEFPRNNYMVPIAVGHLDTDGIDDIVAVGYDPPILYGYPSGGQSFESYLGVFPPVGNYYRSENDFPKVFLKDIDSDSQDEILVFIYSSSIPKTFLFDSNGELINIFDYYAECFPVDMDGNGIDEIYACNRNFCLLRQIDYIDGSTTDSLLIQMNGSNFNCTGMSGFDIDNDDLLELILYGYYVDFGFWIYAFEDGLNLIAGWPHDMGIDDFVVPTVPIFGDIDKDGGLEYFSTYFDISASYILAWNLDGTPYVPGNSNGLLTTTPEPSVLNMLLLADINGDDMADIIACADNDMFNTYNAQRIYAWDSEGHLLSGFPLITVQDVFTSDRFTPSVGDISGDGLIDLTMTTPDSKSIFVNFSSPYDSCSSPAPFWRYNRRMNNIGRLPSACNLTAVDDSDRPVIPDVYRLAQNYPNPFNPRTRIEYSLPSRSHVVISVYNILGQKVKILVDATSPAGHYSVEWDSKDEKGVQAASGIYLYLIHAGEFAASRKMILLK